MARIFVNAAPCGIDPMSVNSSMRSADKLNALSRQVRTRTGLLLDIKCGVKLDDVDLYLRK